jgi:rRNA processing protein Gar1
VKGEHTNGHSTVLESRTNRLSTNKAILAEIQRLLIVLKRHQDWWNRLMKASPKETNAPLVPFTTPVFDEQVKAIGNVDTAIVGKVVAFFGYVKFINAIQLSKPGSAAIGKQDDFDKLYASILDTAVKDYSGTFDAAFKGHE